MGAVYLSAIIGAGFASGREIMTYFACFGYKGIIGLLIACALIAFCGSKAFIEVKRLDIDSPHALNMAAGGKVTGMFLTACCGAFAYSAYIIMLAGIRELCGGGLIGMLSVLIVSVGAYAVLSKGFGILVKICGILAPSVACAVAFTALAGSFVFTEAGGSHAASGAAHYDTSLWGLIMKALLYAGYNVLTSICVLGRSKQLITKKSDAVWGGITGGAMLFISGCAVLVALVHADITPQDYEMPVLGLFEGRQTLLFSGVLLSAMLMSALTGLTSTCVFFTGILPERKLGLILGLAAIPAAYISFGSLMDILYPIFGFAGIFLIIVLALMGRKNV